MIFSTRNHNKTEANGIELSFEPDDKVKVDPEKKATEDFGIAYTGIKEAPERRGLQCGLKHSREIQGPFQEA